MSPESTLQPDPREIGNQALTLADRLALSFRAAQDFSASVNILLIVEGKIRREDTALKISRQLAQSGKGPLALPSNFLAVAEQREPENRFGIYGDIALLQADMGDISAAMQTAELVGKSPWFYIEFAKVVAEKGGDPQSIFDQIHEQLRTDAGSTGDVTSAGFVAEAQRALGIVPSKQVIDRFIRKHARNDEYSNSYNLELATAYARGGFPQDALKVWETTKETGYHHRAAVLSRIAISFARNGVDPSRLAEMTMNQAEAVMIRRDYNPAYFQTEIYANLSRAYAFYGLNPQPLIDRALQKAPVEPSNMRSNAYIEIARAQISYGFDARATLAQALEVADCILGVGEKDDGYNGPIQMATWEEIFHEQLNGGYFDDARDTLERMDRSPDIAVHKAEFLAELAKMQARKGLSQDQIDILSNEQIQAMLGGGNELTKQAVAYFGLDKKTLQ